MAMVGRCGGRAAKPINCERESGPLCRYDYERVPARYAGF